MSEYANDLIREARRKKPWEIRSELESLSQQGMRIYEQSVGTGRAMTAGEQAEFDSIADTKIPQLKKELQASQATQKKLLDQAWVQVRSRENGENMKPTLPINGIVPSELENQYQPHANLRVTKLRAFASEREAYNAGMWLRAFVAEACHGIVDQPARDYVTKLGWQVRNAQTEGQGPSGGYLVPNPLSQTLIDLRERVGITRQLLDVMPMTSETLSLPKIAGGLTVFGANEAPSSDFTTSDMQFEQLELIAKKRYVASYVSQELVDDALISIVDRVFADMARALARAEDAEFIDGDGTSTYRGVVGLKNAIGSAAVVSAASGNDTWPEITLADIMGAIGKLPSQFQQEPGRQAWICSSEFFYSVMLRVALAAGGVTLAEMMGGPDGRPMFLGKPVFFTSLMPTATAADTVMAFYGDFMSAGMLGDRLGVRLARSDDFQFLRDLVTLKGTSRYDINLHELGDATTAGAVIAFKTAS